MHRDRPATLYPVPSSNASATDVSLADRGRRSLVARALSTLLAITMWVGPMSITLQQSRQAAGVIAAGVTPVDGLATHVGAVRQGLLSWAMARLPVVVSFGPAEAAAAPVVDPNAPIRFTPAITATTGPGAPAGGVPVVGITTPNAQGVSLNQYRSFVVDPIGLILNNSVTGGGAFLGGQVAGNANLAASGPARLIVNQVTSSAPAQINGMVEVFGAQAGVVIAAPGGIYTSGAGFTNTSQVTLTTGTPQWLSASGASTSFDAAATAGFLVEGGRIQIGNPTPGASSTGIEGSVGSISLIAESIGVDAAINAGRQINLIAGRQLVRPDGDGLATSPAGANTAAVNTTAANGLAIDATAFGAMNAGQIHIVSTAAGVGVRADGNLAASAGGLTIDAAGNLRIGSSYAKQEVALKAGGALEAAGNGIGEAGYTVNAQGDVALGGTLESGRGLTVTSAEGAIQGAGGVRAQQAVALDAATHVDVGGAVNGATISVKAAGQGGSGDIRLGGDVTSPGTIALQAARDTVIDGSAVSAGDLNLASQRNLTIRGAAGSTTGNVSLVGVDGSVTTSGNVVSPGTLSVKAGTDVQLGGQVVADGALDVTAQTGSIATSGQIGSNAGMTLRAARDVTIGGQAQSAGDAAITATQGNVAVNGAMIANGNATVSAGGNAVVSGSLSSGANANVTAATGSATISGALTSLGNAGVSAAQDATLSGSTMTGGNLGVSAGRTLQVGDLTWVGKDATLRGGDVAIGAPAGKQNAINGTLDAAATRGLTMTGDTTATNITLSGATVNNAGGTVAVQRLQVSAGSLTNAGTLAGSTVKLDAANLTNRGVLGGQTVNITVANAFDNAAGLLSGAQSLTVSTGALASNQGGTIFAGDLSGQNPLAGNLVMSVLGGDGSFNNVGGQLLAGNDLTLHAWNQVFDPSAAAMGKIDANGTVTLGALAIHNTGTWTVPGGSVVLDARQGISNSGTIQKAGDLSLATGGALTNTGQIVGGSNVSLSAGNLTNTGTLHANADLALDGNVTNRGVAEALGNIAITGSHYDNTGAKTQANGSLKIDIDGTVTNTGGVLGAIGDLHIAAGAVVNDRAGPVDAGSTTGKVNNDALLASTVIGSYAPWVFGNTFWPRPGVPVNLTLGDIRKTADGKGIAPELGWQPYSPGGDAGITYLQMWQLVDATSRYPVNGAGTTLALPTVDRTVVKQTDGTAGQIIAGGNLDIAASTLSNKGGVISAARDVTLDVGSLDNGRSATLVNGVTDAVNQAEFAALLASLKDLAQNVPNSQLRNENNKLLFGTIPPPCMADSCGAAPITAAPVNVGLDSNNAAVAAPTQSSTTYQLGKAGQITSGGNLALNGTGDLTNAGDIAAAGNIRITTPGTFTNQGVHEVNVSTVQGCVPGADCPDDSSPTVQSVVWKQTPSTVAAGNALTINAGGVQNLSATLAAQGRVDITAGGTVTNEAGAIQSVAGDVAITAASLVNTSLDPVQLHKSYGGQNPPYAGGCNPGGTYGNSQCAAKEDAATGPAGVISGARDVTIETESLDNHGALISGGRDVSIRASGGVDNTAIALNADWIGRWQEDRSGGDRWHDTGGRAAIGNIASGIRAGNTLSVSAGGQIVNTGNLMGAAVDLTGASMVNGITSPDQPTPGNAAPRQVIPLGPMPVPAGSLPATTPAADPTQPWQFTPVIVATPGAPTTGSTPTVDWHFSARPDGTPISTPTGQDDRARYVSPNPATGVLAGVTPDSLIGQLPPALRPGNVTFYYDPYTEGQKLQQAALAQTGQDSFINGLAWDSQNNLSVADQEKLALYKNAADYAKAHHIALGTALSDDQVKALDAPMLWYVEQAVPDPRCTAASTICPPVKALVPQVYLPEGYAQALAAPTGGTISGETIRLTVDGQLRNSGQVIATDTLAVKAGSLDLSPNVVSIGTNAYKAQGGWNVVTGTVVQPGGFLSAMHMEIEADSIRAINDAFRITRPDGSVDEEASAALVAQLKESLGLDYTEGTVADDIHTRFIKEKKGFGVIGQIVAMVAAVAISIVTAGAGAALMGVAVAQMTAMQAAAVAMVSGTLSSMVSQVITTGSLNIGAALKAGAISGLTAGLTHGALGALGLDKAGIGSIGDNIAQGNWTQAAGQLGSYAQASVVRSAISAGITTVAYGGSFGQAFAGGLVRDAAALAANAAGVKLPGIGSEGATTNSIIANAAAHALIGCAAQGLTGGDCAGGAVGGAASAIAAPLIRDGIYADSPVLNYSDDPVRQAVTVGLATLIGGATGALLGRDATSASLAAQNEALNNATSTGPARGIANRENARLTKLCEPNCTQEDFNRIDTQVRQVEAAATLARLNNLTPEQALKLGDMLTSLLPLYGTPAALYQAVTGQGLSGQPLGTAERWLMSIAGVLPVAGVAYSKISEFIATKGAAATAEIIFKTAHYASRLDAAGVNIARAEAAVVKEVNAMRGNMAANADVVGRLIVDGVKVEYRARLLPNGTVNVGTLFPVK
ncbi:beta strand repeat-containing protein [Cupriavidus pauculus]|uniref:beta strand repeat-containing protein n=1 Tax=Cupriavidus pauculus TaxID=82633 RepID=UPI0020A2C4F5|nr:filamentous hemagglutinin N-terminal domain-containing protein [Cupriavidus pauculus]